MRFNDYLMEKLHKIEKVNIGYDNHIYEFYKNPTEYEINQIMDIIYKEYNDINHIPKKILIDKQYVTKDINSGEMIKTDTKKLLEKVLNFGKQTY